jgi:hypothetical protein
MASFNGQTPLSQSAADAMLANIPEPTKTFLALLYKQETNLKVVEEIIVKLEARQTNSEASIKELKTLTEQMSQDVTRIKGEVEASAATKKKVWALGKISIGTVLKAILTAGTAGLVGYLIKTYL